MKQIKDNLEKGKYLQNKYKFNKKSNSHESDAETVQSPRF